MAAVIVGLGNPGPKYERTRHNAGFWAVDRFAARFASNMSWKERSGALFLRTQVADRDTILVKPQLFMNRSGEALQAILHFFQIPLSDILVVYDELDFDCGIVKLRIGGSAGGHRGVTDIIERCGGEDFARVRIGIGHPRRSLGVANPDVSAWVLGIPNDTDRALLENALETADKVLETWVRDGLDAARRVCGSTERKSNG